MPPTLGNTADRPRSILVVEDEEAIRLGLCDRLQREGFSVLEAPNGREALAHLERSLPDLVLLDVLLPDISGFDVCSRIRSRGSEVPILMLTARDLEADKVHGLDLGADDYITKPFGIEELLARIRAHLRRGPRGSETATKPVLCIGAAEVDLKACRIVRDGEEFSLSPMEVKMLEIFIRHRGEVVTRESFLNRIWGYEASNTRTVDFHVFRLRRKLEQDSNRPRHLTTVHGHGYRLEDEA